MSVERVDVYCCNRCDTVLEIPVDFEKERTGHKQTIPMSWIKVMIYVPITSRWETLHICSGCKEIVSEFLTGLSSGDCEEDDD